MQFMVIERFRNQDAKAIYRRLAESGRMTPDGLEFVESWVSADLDRCFQVMACDDVTLLQRWVSAWSDLVEFEIVPVCPGRDTGAALHGPSQVTKAGKAENPGLKRPASE